MKDKFSKTEIENLKIDIFRHLRDVTEKVEKREFFKSSIVDCTYYNEKCFEVVVQPYLKSEAIDLVYPTLNSHVFEFVVTNLQVDCCLMFTDQSPKPLRIINFNKVRTISK